MQESRSVIIKESISSDGLGIPTISVYMSLCDKKSRTGKWCKSCQNPEMQSNNLGYKLSISEIIEIIEPKINRFKEIFGKCELALLGGEPLSKFNRSYSYKLAKYFNSIGIQTIVYTWRTKKIIKKEKIDIEYYDRVVCGEYIDELNIGDEYILGSTNQKIINNRFKTILKYERND